VVYDFVTAAAPTAGCTRCSANEDRASGHVAESSFGAHVFNTLMTYRDEPHRIMVRRQACPRPCS